MRELKFRAWGGGKMVYNLTPGNNYPDQFTGVLMQFTGLHDKNGKEIYEGDLLRVFDGTRNWVTHVQFDTEMGWYHRASDYRLGEIIGNIWENPELLTP